MSEMIEFDSVAQTAVVAIGAPGERVFFLQVIGDGQSLNLKVEKEQMAALGQGTHELLLHLGLQDLVQRLVDGIEQAEQADPEPVAPIVEEPPRFAVNSIALGFDEVRSQVMLECEEFPQTDDEPSRLRLWLDPEQLVDLAIQGLAVAARGRPLCQMCGLPMQPDGHVCPATNGHRSGV